MFECVPPASGILLPTEGETTENEQTLLALATMFGQISTSLGRSLQVYAERAGLTLLDGQALYTVWELGTDARPGTIADQLKMPLSTMTGVANRLVTAGLVIRRPAPGDGRAAILEITDAGRGKVQEMFRPVIRDVAEILEESAPETIEQIMDGFRLVLSLTETLEQRVKVAGAR